MRSFRSHASLLRPLVPRPALGLSLALACAVAGCSRSEAPAPAVQAAPTAALPKPLEAPKPTIEDNTFKLSLVPATGYNGSKEGKVELTLEARGGYHVNQDYPIRVDLKAPADVKLDKTTLGKPDAAEFSEHSARFELPFAATSGAHDLVATVDFAVCTKETCLPDQRTVALALQVQ
ncbi:MAG: hypothetical protein JWN48_4002 [Myxococcaceae bacterium]|nr:hypothetical protein [Myxococcaceae bacterium]